jgi:outer membrane protein
MKPFLILCVSLLSFVKLQAQNKTKQVYAFSLEECVAFAKKNNVQVKNSLLAIDAQIQTNREIGAAAYPSINTNAGVNDFIKIPTSLLPAQIFGGAAGTYIPVQFGTKYNANYGASFQQILFDGQVFIALKARATSLEWQKKNFVHSIICTQHTVGANKSMIGKFFFNNSCHQTVFVLIILVNRFFADT